MRDERCAICSGPWDGHLSVHDLTMPMQTDEAGKPIHTCRECDEAEPEPTNHSLDFMRIERRDGSVHWGYAFVSRPDDKEVAR